MLHRSGTQASRHAGRAVYAGGPARWRSGTRADQAGRIRPGGSGASGSGASGGAAAYFAEGVGQDGELAGAEDVDEQLADQGDVAGGGLFEALAAGLGEDGEDAADVGGTGPAGHQARFLQLGDLVGQPALGGQQGIGQFGHAQLAVRGVSQPDQDLVLRMG